MRKIFILLVGTLFLTGFSGPNRYTLIQSAPCAGLPFEGVSIPWAFGKAKITGAQLSNQAGVVSNGIWWIGIDKGGQYTAETGYPNSQACPSSDPNCATEYLFSLAALSVADFISPMNYWGGSVTIDTGDRIIFDYPCVGTAGVAMGTIYWSPAP